MTDERETAPAGARAGRRPETLFLAKFLGLLVVFFAAVAPRPLNDALVEPFTAGVARAGGAVIALVGEDVRMTGTTIASSRFAVDIRNGCNGLETVFLFAAAVLAFPAPWKLRLAGLAAGTVLIQLFNLVRIASLYFIGLHFPRLFEESHVVVFQVLVVLFGVALFLVWAHRYALPPRPATRDARP